MNRTTMLLGVLLAVSPAVAAQKIYKWKDADGNVVYSSSRPADVSVKEMRPRIDSVSPEAARKQLDALTGRANSQRQNRELAEQTSATDDAVEKRRKDNCAQALKNLDILMTSPRVQTTDSEGNLFYLDEQSKQAKTAETQRQVDEYCQ